MTTLIKMPEQFTETAKTTLEGIKYLTNSRNNIALLAESVFCFTEKKMENEEEFEEFIAETCEDILSCHPDFVRYPMDNGSTLVLMSQGPCGYYIPPADNGEDPSFAEICRARNEILCACEEPSVIAVYLPD